MCGNRGLGLGKLQLGSKGQLAVPRAASMRPTPRFHYARTFNSIFLHALAIQDVYEQANDIISKQQAISTDIM